jgi:voltage-gated potassium channel
MRSQVRGQNQDARLGGILLGIIATLLTLLTILALFLWSEGDTPPSYRFWDGLENAIIALMGEYPDRPTTPIGRVLQLLLLMFGTFIFGAISGKVSSVFVTRALIQEVIVRQFTNHIIICNWNSKATSIIYQLLEGNKKQPIEIVVVSATAVEDSNGLSSKGNVYFVQDDPTHHATLERLNASRAKSVILLADQRSQAPDEKNALIALAIKHLEAIPGQQRDIHVIAELVNLNRRRHLQEAGVDEVISAADYSAGVIAQSAMFENMSLVYLQLLTYSDDSNELYYIEAGCYPAQLQGKTFTELSHWISQYSATQSDNPMVLLGIKRSDGEILLNPKRETFDRLAADDTLVVMAFRDVKQIG